MSLPYAVLGLALAGAKLALGFAAPYAVKFWLATKSAGLFAYLSSHGITISAGAQAGLLTATAAALVAKQQGLNEQEQIEAATKAVARSKLTSVVKPKAIKAMVDYINSH